MSLTTQISNLTATHQCTELRTLAARPRVSRKKYRIPSILETFGITQHKTISYIRRGHERSYDTSAESQHTVCETREFLIWWRVFGFGRRWEFQYPYGSILPSLSVHPIVKYFDNDVHMLIDTGSIQDIQRYFATGELHPFTRNIHGQTLLHLAAGNCRPELCRLLIDYGVKGDDNDRHLSLLSSWTFSVSQAPITHQINSIRILLTHDDFAFDNPGVSSVYLAGKYRWNKQLMEWVSDNATTFYCDEEAMLLREFMLYTIITRLGSGRYGCPEMFDFLCESIDEHSLTQYKRGSLRLLPHLFIWTYCTAESIPAGEKFIALLAFWGCDVEACIRMELEALEDGCLTVDEKHPMPRKVVFTGDRHQGWSLGWEWAYDFQNIGYGLVSEYSNLAADVDLVREWPFYDQIYGSRSLAGRRMQRFNRRMAAKARKEQTRLGQKKTRSKMPGAWL